MPAKHSYEYIKDCFAAKGYVLLSKKYAGNKKALRLLCPNAHECTLTFNAFANADAVCRYCTIRYHYNDIKKMFESDGYTLLTRKEEYKNCTQKIKSICSEGHPYDTQVRYFIRGNRCRICSAQKRSLGYEYVKGKIEEAGYVLLSKTYKNKDTRLICRCPEGHIVDTTTDNFITNGARCVTCRWIKASGPGSPWWKGGVSFAPYCVDWTKDLKDYIKYRDGYTCLNPHCTKVNNKLCVHHIDYNKKTCGPENLITVCNSCNTRANTDREWHEAWYKAILSKRYGYEY